MNSKTMEITRKHLLIFRGTNCTKRLVSRTTIRRIAAKYAIFVLYTVANEIDLIHFLQDTKITVIITRVHYFFKHYIMWEYKDNRRLLTKILHKAQMLTEGEESGDEN